MTWAIDEKGYSSGGPAGWLACSEDLLLCLDTAGRWTVVAAAEGMASQRRRFSYRRVGLLLARQAIRINREKLYRLFTRRSG